MGEEKWKGGMSSLLHALVHTRYSARGTGRISVTELEEKVAHGQHPRDVGD